MRSLYGVLLTAALPLVACQSSAPSVDRPAAIKVRLASVTPLPTEFSQTGPNVLLLRDGTVGLIDDGSKTVYLLDVGARTVVRRLGRRGGGPGEFMGPTALETDSMGRIAVADVSSRRLSVFDREGRLLSTLAIPGLPGRILRLAGDTVLLDWLAEGSTPVLGLAHLGEQRTEVLGHPFAADSSLMVVDKATRLPLPFLAYAGRPDGSVLIASPWRYSIDIMRPDGTAEQWASRPEVEPTYLTAAEVEERVATIARRMAALPAGARMSTEELRKQASARPKPYLWGGGLFSDRTGRLWAVTGRGAGDTTVVDLFASTGAFLQSLSFPQAFTHLDMHGDTLAFVSTTGSADGAAQLFLYDVVE